MRGPFCGFNGLASCFHIALMESTEKDAFWGMGLIIRKRQNRITEND
jgi:predicted NAD-dependent protein-ADP-ribosyltransferase YbiA (DUF1768 family)